VVTGSKPDSIFLVFEYAAHDLGRLLDSMPTPFTESEVRGQVAAGVPRSWL